MPLYYDPKTKQLIKELPLGLLTSALLPTYYPALAFLGFVIDRFSKPGSLKGDDAENIETIIRAGKDNDVDEMEIELDREVVQGLDVKAFESVEGVNITLGQKGKSCYKLKVKYK